MRHKLWVLRQLIPGLAESGATLKFWWKQALPLTYWSSYLHYETVDQEVGVPQFCIWRMWLGRSFSVTHFPAV